MVDKIHVISHNVQLFAFHHCIRDDYIPSFLISLARNYACATVHVRVVERSCKSFL